MSTELRPQNQGIEVFDELLADVLQSTRPLFAITVSDQETQLKATAAAGQVADLLKKVEARRKELLAPLKAQVEAINAAAEKVRSTLSAPDQHLRGQLNSYASELARKRAEELRVQREKEEAERRAAEERRQAELRVLREKQEAERREREAAAAAERAKIEEEAKNRAAAASLFGGDVVDQARVEREAEASRRAAEAKAAADARALAEQQERDRLAEEARLQREADERARALEEERARIEAMRVKGAKVEINVEVVDVWAVPREFLRDPEVKVAEVKKAYKLGMTEIPGLKLTESTKVAVRAQGVVA